MNNPFATLTGMLGDGALPDAGCVDKNGKPIPGINRCCTGYVDDAGKCADPPSGLSGWAWAGIIGGAALLGYGGYRYYEANKR